MTKTLERAIEKVKSLSDERQAIAAEILEQVAATGDGAFQIPDEHRAALFEGTDEADIGRFASEQEMAALWKKCGL